MASNSPSTKTSTQARRTTSFGQQTSHPSLLVDKTKAHIRRSTPDSEALASSDDEQDFTHRMSLHQAPKPVRRPSWLSDSGRKSSYGTSDAVSPGWDLGVGTAARSNSNTSFSPWGGASIWNDTQRNPPARLAELRTNDKTGRASEDSQNASLRRDSTSDTSIPFAIPLQPTLKTYRSQSYSVGQMEDEASTGSQNRPIQAPQTLRNRVVSGFAGAQHRPSRPSLLSGDFSPESSTILEQVSEVAGDEDGSNVNSHTGIRLPGTYNRTMEQVAMENILRQQQQYNTNKMSSERSNSFSAMQGSHASRFTGQRSLYTQESVLEETDDPGYGGSRGSSHTTDPFALSTTNIENRNLENVKKGHWSSSLGFGGLQDVPQSRRHSFADVPTRGQTGSDLRQLSAEAQSFAYGDANSRMPGDAASFFSANHLARSNDAFRPSSSSSSIQQGYGGISQSPAPQLYQSLNPSMQSLYVVTFKAARAEFYYVQEGTGLEVNEGDLVIVEADRGTDLGTVACKNVDWSMAREVKEKYAAEHYNWLMMFSKYKQNSQTSPPGTSSGQSFGSAIGGMRPNPANSPPDNGEIKPKMIKRLAQPHEIQMLRDKEANEAKAKRMCVQKVSEHHLAMEILDAEFQMDWKKLTFYYYADAYVNFNNLVTDLFKAYKTRIWMSAINPDSFVSPVPGGMPQGRGRERFPDARPTPEGNGMSFQQQSDMQSSFNNGWPASQEMLVNSMGPSAYSHFFSNQAQGYPNMGMMQQNFGRSMYQGYRDGGQASNHQYGEQVSGAGYSEQLRAFQGLSLGQ